MNDPREFTIRLADLLSREHAAMANFLVALAEFDHRRLWVPLGHSSLFYFLHRELGLSKGAAHYRKTAAELLQRFPQVEAPLRDGRLCLSSIVELAKVITPENRGDVLPRFFHCSKQEAKAITAELHPVDAVPYRDVVTALRSTAPQAAALALEPPRRLPEPVTSVDPKQLVHPDEPVPDPGQLVHPDELPSVSASSAPASGSVCAPPASADARAARDCADPLTAELSRLHVTVSRGFLAKVEAARAALSHSVPGATMEQILEAGLDLVLDRHAKRKGLVEKPRKTRRPAKPEHIPAHVKRAVWVRDGGRCQYPLESGGICGCTRNLEFDHIKPLALGGTSTVDNVRVACRRHNLLSARLALGDELMNRYTRDPRKPRDPLVTGGERGDQGNPQREP